MATIFKSVFAKAIALMLVAMVVLSGCSSTPGSAKMSGNYDQDAATVVATLRHAIEVPQDSPEQAAVREEAREVIDAFAAIYKANRFSGRQSYTTLRTVSNTLASYYRGSRARPIRADKLERVQAELDRADKALSLNR